jgi:hypothetical protein
MADQPASQTSVQKKLAVIPVVDGLTPEKWSAAMSRKPDGVTRKDWSILTTTLFEIQAKRIIQPSQLAHAKNVADLVKASPAMQKMLADADNNRLTLATTEVGKQQIASQPRLKFQSVVSSPTGIGYEIVPIPPPTATTTSKQPTSAPVTRTQQVAHVATATSKKSTSTPVAHSQQVNRPTTVAANKPAPPGGVKIPTNMPPDQVAGYKAVVTAVITHKAQGISYGKLNSAYEIAGRAKDDPTRDVILSQMHKLRPLVKKPARYGVSDAEYANYALVENAIKGNAPEGAISQKNWVLAHKTAIKYGHTEQAEKIAEQLPAGTVGPTIVIKADKKPATAPARVANTVKVAAPAAGATDAAIAAIIHKKSDTAKPGNVSDQDWMTCKSVLDQLGKGVIPPQKDLSTAAQVSGQMQITHGTKYPVTNTILLRTLAMGNTATVKQLSEARRLAIADKKSDAFVKIFSKQLVMTAIKSNNPADMKIAEPVARANGDSTIADSFALKMKSFAPVATVATVTAVAATKAVPSTTKMALLGPPPAGIPAEQWKKCPPPPAGVSVAAWRQYATVNYFLNEKGQIPSVSEAHKAAQIAIYSPNPYNAHVLTALAMGDAATVVQLNTVRSEALATNHVIAANAIGQRIIVAAHKSGKPEDLKTGQLVAQQMGHTETAAAFAKKIAPVAGVATAAAAVAVATAPRTHQGDKTAAPSRSKQAPSTSPTVTAEDKKAVDDGLKKLTTYEQADLLNATAKLSRNQPVTLDELTAAQAAADKAGLRTPALKFGKAASDLHVKMAAEQEKRLSGTAARLATRKTPVRVPPAVAAKVPVIPPPTTIADQSAKLNVPPQATQETLQTAKGSGPEAKEAQQNIAQGTATAQAAADGNAAAQKHIADLQQAATQPGPEGLDAQKKLAGIAAGNAITVTVNNQMPPGASPPPPSVTPSGAPQAPSYSAPEPRGEALPPPLMSSAPTPRGRGIPVSERTPAPPPPPPPTPDEVSSPGDTPVDSKLVKGAAVALGIGSAAGAAAVILGAKKGSQSDVNNMQAGARVVDDMESSDPATRANAQKTIASLKADAKSGDSFSSRKLDGIAAAAATKKAIEAKQRKDQAAVLKEIHEQEIQASIAGPDTGNYVPAVLGSLLLAGGGIFMAMKSKRRMVA